jgi:hypothetical protein
MFSSLLALFIVKAVDLPIIALALLGGIKSRRWLHVLGVGLCTSFIGEALISVIRSSYSFKPIPLAIGFVVNSLWAAFAFWVYRRRRMQSSATVQPSLHKAVQPSTRNNDQIISFAFAAAVLGGLAIFGASGIVEEYKPEWPVIVLKGDKEMVTPDCIFYPIVREAFGIKETKDGLYYAIAISLSGPRIPLKSALARDIKGTEECILARGFIGSHSSRFAYHMGWSFGQKPPEPWQKFFGAVESKWDQKGTEKNPQKWNIQD